MQDFNSVATITDIIQSAEELVADLKTGTPQNATMRAQIEHIRQGVVALASIVVLHDAAPQQVPRGEGAIELLTTALRADLLRAWGFANFIRFQLTTGRPNHERLADYAEGLRDVLVEIRMDLLAQGGYSNSYHAGQMSA
jgi:hypothetical protein